MRLSSPSHRITLCAVIVILCGLVLCCVKADNVMRYVMTEHDERYDRPLSVAIKLDVMCQDYMETILVQEDDGFATKVHCLDEDGIFRMLVRVFSMEHLLFQFQVEDTGRRGHFLYFSKGYNPWVQILDDSNLEFRRTLFGVKSFSGTYRVGASRCVIIPGRLYASVKLSSIASPTSMLCEDQTSNENGWKHIVFSDHRYIDRPRHAFCADIDRMNRMIDNLKI